MYGQSTCLLEHIKSCIPGKLRKLLWIRLVYGYLFGVSCLFEHYLSDVAVATPPIYAFLESLFPVLQQYFFQLTSCFFPCNHHLKEGQ